MKAWLFTYLFIAPFCLKAQLYRPSAFTKGDWQVGLYAGYQKHRTSTQIHSGYLVADKFLLGLEASWARESSNNLVLNSLRIGPLVRYQFSMGRLSPFISASYQLGKQQLDSLTISYRSPILHQSIILTPGLSLQLSSAWEIDLSYRLEYNQSYRIQRFGGQDFSTQRYIEYYNQLQLGINYFINRKK